MCVYKKSLFILTVQHTYKNYLFERKFVLIEIVCIYCTEKNPRYGYMTTNSVIQIIHNSKKLVSDCLRKDS